MVMDSRALLDYALFQLTPTRTRCDLVIFSGRKNEKVASGLLEPFLSHLKSAKDQISKGGYSITLKPPSDNCPWFTKATLERFVRFVSTPEVLERVVTIEREIDQIERSVELTEHGALDGQGNASASDGDAKISIGYSKSKLDSCGSGGADAEENPKVRLQRVLESRKAMLKKEQAMAYARSLVAGFEIDNLHDLVSFGDAFGALRLREACINFMELCNKKNKDKVWMDEVAAMQASYFGASGIMLSVENNDLSQTGPDKSSTTDSITRHGSLDTTEELNLQQSEGATQLPPWPHYLPQYMHNTQGPIFQQMPPYPGYVFPGMPGAPLHYPDNLPWPMNFQDPGMYVPKDIKDNQRYKSSTKRKEKHANHGQPKSTVDDESAEAGFSSSGTDSSDNQEQEPSVSSEERIHRKKLNRRHSSKQVVIRNINYITSGRTEGSSRASDSDSSGEDGEYIDAGSLKLQVEEAVGSLKRHQKPTSLKSKGPDGNKKVNNKSNIDLDFENVTANSVIERKGGSWDIFQNLLMRDSESVSEDAGSKAKQVREEGSTQNGHGEENVSLREPAKPNYAGDDLFFTERSKGNGAEKADIKFEDEETLSAVVKRGIKQEELLMPLRMEGEHHLQNACLGTEPPLNKSRNGEDWIIGSKLETAASLGGNIDQDIFHGDQYSTNHFQGTENTRGVFLDDSLMVQSHSVSYDPPQNLAKVDVFMLSDIDGSNKGTSNIPGNSQANVEASIYSEPDDLYMVIGRDTAAEQVTASWRPEMDYGKDISLVETVANQSCAKQDDKTDYNGNKNSTRAGKESGAKVDRKTLKPKIPSGSLGRSKPDVSSRSKTSASGNTTIRGKTGKEEDKRKKMEELLKQRQKRIAERSGAKGVSPETSRRIANENKKKAVSTKTEKTRLQSPSDENKSFSKPVLQSSTINRLAAPWTNSKQLPNEMKVGQNRKPTSKVTSVTATSLIKKTKGTQQKQGKDDLSGKKAGITNNSKSGSSNSQKNNSIDTIHSGPEEPRIAEGPLSNNGVENLETVKVLHTVTSVEKRETNLHTSEDAPEKKTLVLSDKELLHSQDPSKQVELCLNTSDIDAITPQMAVYPVIGNNSKSPEANINEKTDEKRKISFSPQISVVDFTTPPPENETTPALVHSRKKWYNGESSPKVPKGFRRLLFFGHRT